MNRTKEYRKSNGEQLKWKTSKRKYGYNITEQEFLKLKECQLNSCAICNKAFENFSQAQVDHCHARNVVRGLLCGRCNTGLGFFKDNIDNLKNAIIYLKCNFSEKYDKMPRVQELLRQKKQIIEEYNEQLKIIDANIERIETELKQLKQENYESIIQTNNEYK